MPLQMDASGNISTPSGDTGTYTWADVVALNSPLMTTHTDTNGRPFYRWRGTLLLRGTSTLNILEIFLELLGVSATNPGRLSVTDSAKINIGQETTVNGKNVHTKGSQILITRKFSSNVDNSNPRFPISFFEGTFSPFYNEGSSSQTAQINIFSSSIRFSALESNVQRIDIAVTSIKSSLIHAVAPDLIYERLFVYTRKGGTIDTSILSNVNIELLGNSITLNNITSISPTAGVVNWSNNRLNTKNFSSINASSEWWTNHKSALDFIDCPDIILALGKVSRDGTFVVPLESRKIVTQNYKLTDNNGNVSGALMSFTGRSNVSATSNSSGVVSELQLSIEETNIASLSFPSTNYGDYARPLPVISYSSYTLDIKSYQHLSISETTTIASATGTSAQPFVRRMELDAGVTESNIAAASAYTGITHAPTSITVTGNLTLNQIYDSRKAYWRNNSGVNTPIVQGDTLDLGSVNITIDGGNVTSTSKFNTLKTTGSFSLLNNGSVNFPIYSSQGIRFVISGLPTKAGSNPLLKIRRISNDTSQYLTTTTGTVAATLAVGEDYEFLSDAIGFYKGEKVTINTGTQSQLIYTLQEIVDGNGLPVYGRGKAAEVACFVIDYSAFTIRVTYDSNAPNLTLYSALDALENGLNTQQGIDLNNPPRYSNGVIFFPNNTQARIVANSTNTGIPRFNFSVIYEGFDTPYALFDTSNGKVIHYPVEVNIAQVGNITATTDNAAIATAVWSNSTRTLTSGGGSGGVTLAEIEASTILAKEATVASRATQTSVNAIPTNPLLSTDTRLNNLDAAITTRLANANYSAPPTTSAIATAVWGNATRTLTSSGSGGATLAEIEASTVLAKEATVASRASQTSVNAIPVNPLLTTDTRLNNLDAAISTRLATTGYTVPPTTGAIATGVWGNTTRTLTSGGGGVTLAEIEGSTVLAKEATVASRASQTSVNAIPTNSLLANDTRLNNLDAAISTRLATTGYTVPPTTSAIATGVWSNSTRSLTVAAGLSTEQATQLSNLNLRLTDARALKLDNLDTTVSSRLATTGYTVPPTTSAIATGVWGSTTRTLTVSSGLTPEQTTQLKELYLREGLDATKPLTINETTGAITVDTITLKATQSADVMEVRRL